MVEIQILPTAEKMIATAAEIITNQLRDQPAAVALSGGSTPLPLYRALGQGPQGDSLAWNKLHFFWGDERMVPPDHADSNYFQAFQTMLEPRQVPADNLHRVKTELEPHLAASRYQDEIRSWFDPGAPEFDLVLLGMGADGHTASLFPGAELAREQESAGKLVGATWVGQQNSWRISFTPWLINQADLVVFLVAGANKAPALAEVLQGNPNPDLYPAQLIKPSSGHVIWLIDQNAAGELTG